MGLAGFGAFSGAAYILVGQVYGSLNVTTSSRIDLVRYGVALLAGMLGGFISVWLWKVALVSLGVLGGLAAGIYALSWRSNGLLRKPSHRTVFIAVLAAAGGLTSLFLESPIIIASTAIVGAISVSAGADVFIDTGFNEAFKMLIQNKGGSFEIHAGSYGLLASCGIAAVLGAAIQTYLIHRKAKTVD